MSDKLFSLETASNIQENWFIIPKTSSDCKKRKLWNILSLQATYLAPTSGNSLVVRQVSPGRILVLLFWTKYVASHQIELRTLKFTITGSQSTICIVFIFVCCAENDCYRVVSARQLSFDCRTYCRRSCRMQESMFRPFQVIESTSSPGHRIRLPWGRVLWSHSIKQFSLTTCQFLLAYPTNKLNFTD